MGRLDLRRITTPLALTAETPAAAGEVYARKQPHLAFSRRRACARSPRANKSCCPELSKFTANGGAAPKYKFALCARRQNSFATLPRRELLKNKLIPLRATGWVSFG